MFHEFASVSSPVTHFLSLQLKRKIGVRGTAGSTPAQPSKASHHRRDSTVFSSTPSLSRPSSVLSDSAKDSTKDQKLASDTPATVKSSVLAKTTRFNALAASASAKGHAIGGSMGPPPEKSRPSISGTPTPTARISSLSRSTSAKPPVSTPITTPHRRVSSATLEHSQTRLKNLRPAPSASPAPSLSEKDEKENVASKTPKRRSMIPTAA